MDFPMRARCVRVFMVFIMTCLLNPSGVLAEKDAQYADSYLTVYYFRGEFRCSNCYKMEEYTDEVMNNYFSNQMASGNIRYKVVNIDKDENHHFIDDYGLYTKSVVLSKVRDGEEIARENLMELWKYIEDKKSFQEKLKIKIEDFLLE